MGIPVLRQNPGRPALGVPGLVAPIASTLSEREIQPHRRRRGARIGVCGQDVAAAQPEDGRNSSVGAATVRDRNCAIATASDRNYAARLS